MNSHSPFQVDASRVSLGVSVARCSARPRRFYRCLLRKVICFALIASLLILAGPGVALNEVRAFATTAVDPTATPIRYLQPILRSLLGLGPSARARRETLADRNPRVSHIRVSPFKLIGYTGEGATFTAVCADLFDRTIAGLKFTWESSDPDKLQIDDAGRVTFFRPRLVRVICRAGTSVGTAPVLIRANHRSVQTDFDWRNDQNGLDASGSIVGEWGDGHTILVAAYQMLKRTAERKDLTGEYFERRNPEKTTRNLGERHDRLHRSFEEPPPRWVWVSPWLM